MNITEKYLEALKSSANWLIVSDWAIKVGELYPDILTKADSDASNQAQETTGLREIAARISSAISRGAYAGVIEIDDTERPRQVRFLPEDARQAHIDHDVDEDVAPLRRDEIIKLSMSRMDNGNKYRVTEFEAISKQLKIFFGIEFEVDHANALLNNESPGHHHPDNFQLLIKAHNGKKNNKNWERFTLEEQVEYIKTVISLQSIVASRLNIEMENNVLDSLLERIRNVY